MSCDLGCVGEWAGGDSDCGGGGVVGGAKMREETPSSLHRGARDLNATARGSGK